MKIKNLFIVPTLLLALTGAVACGNSKKADSTDATEKKVIIKAPDFNADSAYTYVKAQTDFGPRVPNTQAHRDCGAYLAPGRGLHIHPRTPHTVGAAVVVDHEVPVGGAPDVGLNTVVVAVTCGHEGRGGVLPLQTGQASVGGHTGVFVVEFDGVHVSHSFLIIRFLYDQP